jgi:hypothetical protein
MLERYRTKGRVFVIDAPDTSARKSNQLSKRHIGSSPYQGGHSEAVIAGQYCSSTKCRSMMNVQDVTRPKRAQQAMKALVMGSSEANN